MGSAKLVTVKAESVLVVILVLLSLPTYTRRFLIKLFCNTLRRIRKPYSNTTGARHSKRHSMPHCRTLPSRKFNGTIPAALPAYFESFVISAAIDLNVMLLTSKCDQKQGYKHCNKHYYKHKQPKVTPH